MAKNLSNTARAILVAAAARPGLHLLPLPTTLKAPKVIIRKTIAILINNGLVAEVPAGPDEPVWEPTDSVCAVTLVATAAGLAAIGIREQVSTSAGPATARLRPVTTLAHVAPPAANPKRAATGSPKGALGQRRATLAARWPSKQAMCIALLRQGNGASIPEMMNATGWQSHSVRGFLSGALKKRLGIDIVSEKNDAGERRYHIAALRTLDAGQ